ncbi:hypothetical protein DFJ73DRAFT_851867 [Zopfochytrium polystomum]|nr:hypothetical protein DFJ73DRAFT_851867 [Zopfochytrium polystomum]
MATASTAAPTAITATATPFRFCLMSDMHTECFSDPAHFAHPSVREINPTGKADYLVLATQGRFRRVFLVAGNHEFYHSRTDTTVAAMETMAAECNARLAAAAAAKIAADNNDPAASHQHHPPPQVVFLNRTRIDDLVPAHNVIVLGCTLWSQLPPDLATEYHIVQRLADFHTIHEPTPDGGARPLSAAGYRAMYEEDRAWLQAELDDIWRTYYVDDDDDGSDDDPAAASAASGDPQTDDDAASRHRRRHHPHPSPPRVVVVTHHAPTLSGTSHPRFTTSPPDPLNHAFASSLEGAMLGRDRVHTWCFGHTHYSTEIDVAGTRVVANQVGYPWNLSRGGEDPDRDREAGGYGRFKVFEV